MFKAFGVVIIVWYFSSLFSETFSALDEAGKATFSALEAAATVSEQRLLQ